MFRKKAQTAEKLIEIILVIAGFLLIASLLVPFITEAKPHEEELLCHSSIAMRVSSALQVGDTDIALTPLLCRTIEMKITGNKEEIEEQLAYLMARCWWMFGEGRYEENLESVGGVDLVRDIFGVSKSKNDAFLCYTVLIDENKIDEGTISGRDLLSYMAEHDHRKLKGMTYLNYIQSYGGPGKVGVIGPFEARNAYGIIFKAKNKKSSEQKEKEEEGQSGWLSQFAAFAVDVVKATNNPITDIYSIVSGERGLFSLQNPLVNQIEFYNKYLVDTETDVSEVSIGKLDYIQQYSNIVPDLGGE